MHRFHSGHCLFFIASRNSRIIAVTRAWLVLLARDRQRLNRQIAAIPGGAGDLHDALQVGLDAGLAGQVRLDLPVDGIRRHLGDVFVGIGAQGGGVTLTRSTAPATLNLASIVRHVEVAR